MRHKSKFNRALALATVFSAVASVAVLSGSANADLSSANTISATSGTAASTFFLGVTNPGGGVGAAATNACQGDTTTNNYRWSQYIAAASVDPATMTILGNVITSTGFSEVLYSTTGSAQANKNTSIGTGQISGVLTNNFQTNSVPGNGAYNVGFICTLAGAVTRHWVTPITVSSYVSATSFNWSFGAAPAAPTALTAVGSTPAGGTITGSFAAVTATPAVTGYTVTATPVGGGAAVTTTVPAAGPYTFSLTVPNSPPNYNVTVTATNSVGTGPAATVAGVLVAPAGIAAPVVTTVGGTGNFTVNWTTPTAPVGAVLQNYTVTVTGAVGSPFTVAAGTNTLLVTVPSGTYPVTVQANYQSPFTSATSAPVTGSSNSSQVIVQDIQVTRPLGALVLTQRCGVFGSAAAYSDAIIGSYPLLGPVPGTSILDSTSADPSPGPTASPDDDFYGLLPGDVSLPSVNAPRNDSAPFDPFTGVTTEDPLFDQYPYPVNANGDSIATYPTNCGIILDTPRLLTSGPQAGNYFHTTGRIAQLTVVNTQNIDGGWTLNGRMGDFKNSAAAGTPVADPNNAFSGNLMGWNPEVTWTSQPNLDGYNMGALAGGVRQPSATASTTGLGAQNPSNTTLASSLAKSNAGSSLGMAVMDARLRLFIPVVADNGVYRGALTFTII